MRDLPQRLPPLRSIMVTVDGSALAEQAVPIALSIARRARGKVRIVLVHARLPPLLPLEPELEYSSQRHARKQAERRYLRRLVGPLRAEMGRKLSTRLLEGPVASTLARYARDIRADLVVMSTHGHGGLRRAWLGSVADELVRTLEIPILLVRRKQGAGSRVARHLFDKILVPLDGSEHAEAILPSVLALAGLRDSEITLVRVVPPPTGRGSQAAETYLDAMADSLRHRGVDATGRTVVNSRVADSILRLARSAAVSLLAVATHGRGGLRRFVLGSVADKLVRGVDVPVLVRRPRPRRANESSKAGARQRSDQ